MITYEPGDTVLHDLDPRSKLLVQVGFALAAVTQTSVFVLAGYTVFALTVLALARLSPIRVLRSFWFILVILAIAPIFATLRFGSPWVVPERALGSIRAGYQVVLVLFVSAAYVRTTPVRHTRAAIQRHVPGKPGQLLGVGIGLVFRMFPVILQDVKRAQLAIEARAGTGISPLDRIRLLTTRGLHNALNRASTLSLALRARCFAWNPTLPELEISTGDYPAIVIALCFFSLAVVY